MSERDAGAYLDKAHDSLAGAASECAAGRYDNCANRAYYACFQTAVAALIRAGIGSRHHAGQWGHDYVQVRFIGELINRRKHYPTALRETLVKGLRLRLRADYGTKRVQPVEATRSLARAREFVEAVARAGGESG